MRKEKRKNQIKKEKEEERTETETQVARAGLGMIQTEVKELREAATGEKRLKEIVMGARKTRGDSNVEGKKTGIFVVTGFFLVVGFFGL